MPSRRDARPMLLAFPAGERLSDRTGHCHRKIQERDSE